MLLDRSTVTLLCLAWFTVGLVWGSILTDWFNNQRRR